MARDFLRHDAGAGAGAGRLSFRLSFLARGAFVAGLFCVWPLSAGRAQALLVLLFGDKFASENVQGGIKFDVVWTTLSGLSSAARLRSWDLGGFLEVKVGKALSVQPEFTFKVPAGAQSLPFIPTGQPAVDSAFAAATAVSVTRTLGYITVPLLLKVRAGRLYFAAGPQIGYVVKAEDHYIGTVARAGDLTYTQSLWGRVNRWDSGLNLLGEFALAPSLGIRSMRIRVSWYHAFGDALADAPGTNDSFGVGFGLPIGGPKSTQK
ncbi:MAG TPA: outer membrane beta-barrel protein [Gemmatimonadales bacterium]|nr:outer membrane beta-barrel protein [Gemmatimonadales bacterium]